MLHIDTHDVIIRHIRGRPGVPATESCTQNGLAIGQRGIRTNNVVVHHCDSVDQRIISDVKNETGKVIKDPAEVGGWPELAAGTPPADGDKDGIPDQWEGAHGLDPRDGSDGGLASENGYRHLENYLNELAGDVIPGDPYGGASSQRSSSRSK